MGCVELLDSSLCDSMYSTLNDTNVFKYDEELKSSAAQFLTYIASVGETEKVGIHPHSAK